MNIELFSLMDLLSNTIKEYGRDKLLRDCGFRRYKDPCSGINSVGSPRLWSCDGKESRPVGDGRKDFERLWEGSRFITREDHTDS
jgi:hypothetical protein